MQLLYVGELTDNELLACFDAKQCLILTKDRNPLEIANITMGYQLKA